MTHNSFKYMHGLELYVLMVFYSDKSLHVTLTADTNTTAWVTM